MRTKISSILHHLGFFLAVCCAAVGSAYRQELTLTVFEKSTENEALNKEGYTQQLDFGIQLDSFFIESYENGAPKQFTSHIQVHTRDGKSVSGTVQVNHPLKVNGWRIYQHSYDLQNGPCSVFMLVKDPWLPGVYLGIFLLLAGALFLPFAGFPANRRARNQWILAYSILLFLCYLIFRFFIQSKEPVPALQSSWFAPHVTVYIFSFILLGAATLLALYLLFIRKSARDIDLQRMDNLVYTGVAFFTFGMLFGALWAQEAWGHYWSWDPKETWSAVTWLCYLLYIHYRKLRPANWRTACVILLFAFLSLQICWWGVNYLLSAKGRSLHVY